LTPAELVDATVISELKSMLVVALLPRLLVLAKTPLASSLLLTESVITLINEFMSVLISTEPPF